MLMLFGRTTRPEISAPFVIILFKPIFEPDPLLLEKYKGRQAVKDIIRHAIKLLCININLILKSSPSPR